MAAPADANGHARCLNGQPPLPASFKTLTRDSNPPLAESAPAAIGAAPTDPELHAHS